MSTLAATSAPPSRRFSGFRILLWTGLAVLIILACAAGYAYLAALSALPQLDGRLQVRGLSAPVAVTRDAHGVPTIEAGTLLDVFFAQGYVTAQDRLWQMDVMRRFASGELSEILGEDTLKVDREQRILGLRAAAKNSLAMASSRDRSFFEAYARGVNAYINAQSAHLPIEFRILMYVPKSWQPEDSIVIANQMVKDLNYHYFEDALDKEKILARLGPELTADLYVNRSWHDRPPTVMREDLDQPKNVGSSDEEDNNDNNDDSEGGDNAVTRHQNPDGGREGPHPETVPVNGSNNWVVSGVGLHQRRAHRDRCIHRKFQCPGIVPNAARMGATGSSCRGDSRQGQAGRHRRCTDYAAWPSDHGVGAGRDAPTRFAMDAL